MTAAPCASVVGVIFAAVAGCGSSASRGPAAPVTGLVADPAIDCSSCAEWNAPRTPFNVLGNTYFVGTRGLSSVLIAGDAGLVLIDAALPQSAALVDANIRALGFRTADIKYILTSHAHFDHLGGVRAMQRFTGATVLASASTAQALALGHPVPEDPQFGTGPLDAFPAIASGVRVMNDGETVRLGSVAITEHDTPGHTPGATSWTWQSCDRDRCLNMAYVDSLTAISNDGFRYSAAPGLATRFRESIQKVASLPCDVLLTPHPAASGMDDKISKRAAANVEPGAAGDPFVDASACEALAARAMKKLDARVADETGP